MNKKPYIIVIVLLVAAIVLSLFLLPKNSEIALMELKDKHFEEALTAYEKQRASGVLTVEIANRLSDLYLQKGQVDKAIEIMEAFIKDHPDNIEARQRLGRFYQYAQRNDDYLRNLEEINELTPSPENLKTLSDAYNFNGNYAKQADTLQKIVAIDNAEKKPQDDPRHFTDLANMQASKKDYNGAIQTLTELKAKYPQQFGYDEANLLVNLELDNKKPDDALMSAAEWLRANAGDTDHAAKLVNLLHYKGNADLAEKLLSSYDAQQIEASLPLLQEKILIDLDSGKEDEVYGELKKLEAAGKLAPPLKERLLYFALVNDDRTLATQMINEVDYSALNETQLSALAELGMETHNEDLLKKLRTTYPDNTNAMSYPVLDALLAMGLHESATNEHIASLEKRNDLGTVATLQLVRSCARIANKECAHDFLQKLPPASEMSDSDLASAASVYLDLHEYQTGEALLASAGARDSKELTEARLKFAAARGDSATVEPWLDQHGKDASPRLLADLFFLSYDTNHLALATVIAERFHEREDTPLSRSILADVYVKTGQFKEAVALLRDSKDRSADDENNYLFALAKLAPSSPAYRKELADYAATQLRSNLPEKRKLSLIYALVAAHDIDPALPYIRELAMKEGGQWASLYAETLDKQGKHDEARQFWVSLAASPHTSVRQQRDIASLLMDNGYRSDSIAIFSRLAANEPASGTDVQTLLYLWGPRPTADQLDWIADRMQRAGTERDHWATILADSVSDEDMIVLAHRSALNIKPAPLASRYILALQRTHSFEAEYPVVQKLAHDNGRTDLLALYAQAARESGAYSQAFAAYDELFKLNGGDVVALHNAGALAYGRADYTASNRYLSQYVAAPDAQRATDPKAYEAYFDYAETLRHDGKGEDAKQYYTLALQGLNVQPTSAETMSQQAQCMVWLGRKDEGLATFRTAMDSYPNDKTLCADYAATLTDLEDYSEARNVLGQPPAIEATAAAPATAALASQIMPPQVSSFALASGNSELALYFTGDPKAAHQAVASLRQMPGVGYVSEGYDSLLLGTTENATFMVSSAGGVPTINTLPAATGSELDAKQMALRYQLLAARIDLETGDVNDANNRINALLPQYQGDPQVLGFAANAENYSGNWPRAQTLLADAEAIAPENGDVRALDDDMKLTNAPGAKLDHEWIRMGNDNEQRTTLSGYGYVNDFLQVGAVLQNDWVEGRNDRLANGRVGDFTDWRQRAELYGMYSWDGGNYVKGSLFANNDTPGAGGYWHFTDIAGETLLYGEFRRPYWEYPELAIDDGTRSRVGFEQVIKPTTRLTITGGPSYNHYDTKDVNDVFSSFEFTMDVVYRLIDAQPFLAVGYGFDGEYELSQKKGFDDNGNYNLLTPLRTREVHFVSLDGGYNFTPATIGEGILGYGYDRFGGHGPYIEGHLTQELSQSFDAQLRASYGFDSGSGAENVARAGAYIRWKY